jgi:hypothetical protein
MAEIDTLNKFLVSFGPAGGIIIQKPPRGPMSPENALLLAAWLVAVAGDEKRFKEIFEAVCNA